MKVKWLNGIIDKVITDTNSIKIIGGLKSINNGFLKTMMD